MKAVRAVICDVYRTILDVREAPANPEERWGAIFSEALGQAPPLSLEQLDARCREIILEDHSEARGRGIAYPEVNWPSVLRRALPVLDVLPPAKLETLIYDHAQLGRSLQIMPDCVPVLRECVRRGILLGIVSNAQAYTLRELRLALNQASLDPAIFQADLTFWSFQHGFSKPDPHVFQILGARLQNRGIEISAALMLGDRADNDILPARAAGWRTWQLAEAPDGSSRGDWRDLAGALFEGDNLWK